jgi:hypothetical protein
MKGAPASGGPASWRRCSEAKRPTMKKIALFIILLISTVSGCSVLANSERFYRDNPPRRINWRHYSD